MFLQFIGYVLTVGEVISVSVVAFDSFRCEMVFVNLSRSELVFKEVCMISCFLRFLVRFIPDYVVVVLIVRVVMKLLLRDGEIFDAVQTSHGEIFVLNL